MKVKSQRSSWNRREHTYDAQGTPAVPLTAHWRWVRGSTVVQDWTALEIETVTEGGTLTDVYVDVAIVSSLTHTPADYTLLIVFDKDLDSELPVEIDYRVRQVKGR